MPRVVIRSYVGSKLPLNDILGAVPPWSQITKEVNSLELERSKRVLVDLASRGLITFHVINSPGLANSTIGGGVVLSHPGDPSTIGIRPQTGWLVSNTESGELFVYNGNQWRQISTDPSGVILLDFGSALFSRNNGTVGVNGPAQRRTSDVSFEDVGSDILRVDTINGESRYLFERQLTPAVQRSDDFSTAWTLSNVTQTPGFVGPSGPTSATRIEFSASAVAQLAQTISADEFPENSDVIVGAWLRGDVGGEILRLGILRKDGVRQFENIVLTTEWAWYRVGMNVLTGVSNQQFCLFNDSAGGIKTVYIQRAHLAIERYPSSTRIVAGSKTPRYADILVLDSSEVPLSFREGAWTCQVRPRWATEDLLEGERRVLCSTDTNNWIGFEKIGGDVFLNCYTEGTLRFGTNALVVARDIDYEVRINLAAGIATFDGVAGVAGTPSVLPGGVPLRWGGMAGSSHELDAGTTQPESI